MNNNEISIVFSSNNNTNIGKISNNYLKSKIISNLKKAESILDEHKFLNLKKDLINYLKDNNTINVVINENNYKIDEIGDSNKIYSIKTEESLNNDDNCIKVEESVNHDNKSINSNDSTYIEKSDDEITEYEEDEFNDKKYDIIDEHTCLFYSELYDEEESIIDNALKIKDENYLKSLNINELRNIMKNNNLKISKSGIYLKKKDMIKEIKKI